MTSWVPDLYDTEMHNYVSKSVTNILLFTKTAYQKAKGLLRGLGFRKNRTKRTSWRETPQHYIKRNWRRQHSMVATHDTNMAAAQHGRNILGHRQQHKEVETTIHHAKQPQLPVRVSMIESLNEKIEIKLSRLSVCCSLFQSQAAANCKEERSRDVCALGTFHRMWLAEWVLYGGWGL
jgi:hypothetical protein